MVNAKYMKVLARLENAACTQKEKDAINMVRGRYVQQFGTDNEYVKALGMLEAAAATQKEKNDVNMIRGKYGLFEMTGGLTRRGYSSTDPDEYDPDLEYENDVYTQEQEGGDPADEMMNEEDSLYNKYGTHMNVVGPEIVRSLDKNVRDEEDFDDNIEKEFGKLVAAGRSEIDINELLAEIKSKAKLSECSVVEEQCRLFSNDLKTLMGGPSGKIAEWINQYDYDEINDAAYDAFKASVKPGRVKIQYKQPVTGRNGIKMLKPVNKVIDFDGFLTKDSDGPSVIIPLKLCDLITAMLLLNIEQPNQYKFNITMQFDGVTFGLRPFIYGGTGGEWRSGSGYNDIAMITRNGNRIGYIYDGTYTRAYRDPKIVGIIDDELNTRLNKTDDEFNRANKGTSMVPNRTREDAYTDFDEAHPDLDDADPYSKYESVNKKDKRGLTEGVAYDENGTLVDDDVDVPEVADTSAEYDATTDDSREKMCRRIAKDTGYPLDAVREICWQVINNNWLKSEEEAKRYGNGLRAYYTQRQVDKSLG